MEYAMEVTSEVVAPENGAVLSSSGPDHFASVKVARIAEPPLS